MFFFIPISFTVSVTHIFLLLQLVSVEIKLSGKREGIVNSVRYFISFMVLWKHMFLSFSCQTGKILDELESMDYLAVNVNILERM